MNKLLIAGKFLDQPKLVKQFSKTVPAVLIAGSAAYSLNHIHKTPQDERRKEFIKNVSVLTATVSSALLAPRISSKIIKETVQESFDSSKLINDFLKKNKTDKTVSEILNKAKNKILTFSQVDELFRKLHSKVEGKKLLDKLIPDPENIDSKHIFSEIGRLSIMGFIPVAGGILGGIAGDKSTEKTWKEKIPDKIKEGSYQFLANIFMCNIGAGVALGILEKMKITSKVPRAIGMIAGIILTGVIGGSAIANLIGKKLIDPFLAHKHHHHHHGVNRQSKGLYSERKPEALDLGLHVDDIATVAVLSGLKWIEPALPILYSISGYRAGIGYRN